MSEPRILWEVSEALHGLDLSRIAHASWLAVYFVVLLWDH